MSSHNERIAAKRQQACIDFIHLTSTNLSTAKHYLKQTAFDLEGAISLFYDAGGEALASDNEEEHEQPGEQQQGQSLTVQEEDEKDENDPISSIMKAARKESPPNEEGSSSFSGRGFSLNSPSNTNKTNSKSPTALKIRVTFYKDGFTAQEEETVEEETNKSRRRGVHSFTSSASGVPSLPQLRTYEENPKFIQDVQQNRVPLEYRRLDTSNLPVPVSILLDDQRKREYPMEIWQKQQQDESKSNQSFSGSGQTLGSTIESSGKNEVLQDNATPNNLGAWFLSLLLSWWRLLLEFLTSWIRRAVPLEKHTVNSSKPTTTISLRIGQNKQRVEFNTDHTVQDLRRYCQIELQASEFELLAGFPPKTIPDTSQTLTEVGLLNSAVDVRVLATGEEKRRN